MICLSRVAHPALAACSRPCLVAQRLVTNGVFHPLVAGHLYSSTAGKRSAFADKETIVRLLNSVKVVGCRDNAVDLSYFTSLVNRQHQQQPFAILQLNSFVLQKDLAMVVSGLSFLKRVGLYPVVMVESMVQQDRKSQIADNLRLADALELRGSCARPLFTNVFVADRHAQDLVANTDSIEQSILHNALPIVSALAETPSGQIIGSVDAAAATIALAKALRPQKVVFVNDAGGIVDANGQKMKRIHMDCPEEMTRLDCAFPSSSSMRRVSEILNPSTAVTITSAAALPNELITACGTGTQLCSGGATLARYHGVRDRFALEQRIPRKSQPHYRYWSAALAACDTVYMVERGGHLQAIAAIIGNDTSQPAVLQHFRIMAAEKDGADDALDMLWHKIREDHPILVWRSTSCEAVGSTAWHFDKADGSLRDREDGSVVFFYGIKNADGVMASLQAAEQTIQHCTHEYPSYSRETITATAATSHLATAVS